MTQTGFNTPSPPERSDPCDDSDERDHSVDLVIEACAVFLLLLVFLALTARASEGMEIMPAIGSDPVAWSAFTA